MATLSRQVRALLRKNMVYQKRNWMANACLVLAPIGICVLLLIIRELVNNALDTTDNRCGCLCLACCETIEECTIDAGGVRRCTDREECRDSTPERPCLPGTFDDCTQFDETRCGLQYSTASQAAFCAIDNPLLLPPLQLVPEPESRAPVPDGASVQADPPVQPATVLYTGANADIASTLAARLYPAVDSAVVTAGFDTPAAPAGGASTGDASDAASLDAAYDFAAAFANLSLGTPEPGSQSNLVDPALLGEPLYYLTAQCPAGGGSGVSLTAGPLRATLECTPVALAQLASADAVNERLYCGWEDARCEGVRETEGYASPIDFTDTSSTRLRFTFWDNYTTGAGANSPSELRRPNAVISAVFRAFLEWLTEGRLTSRLVGIADFPTIERRLTLDFSSLIGPLFYTWILQILLPVMVLQLVYEKQNGLRAMMRMHGLSDVTYWLVMYSWYLLLHIVFVVLLVGVGSAISLNFFRLNDYGVQAVFYLVFIQMQIGLAFVVSTLFSNARTAVVTCFLYVFGSGLVASFLIDTFYARNKWFNTLLYLYPPWGVYRAMWEFGEYAFRSAYTGGDAMGFSDLGDDDNDLWQVLIIFAVEAVLFFAAAWYLTAVLPGDGVRRHWLFCLPGRCRGGDAAAGHCLPCCGGRSGKTKDAATGAQVEVEMAADEPRESQPGVRANHVTTSARFRLEAAEDVREEDERAAAASPAEFPILLQDVRKIYPARDGQAPKFAVQGISLAIRKGECFGLLGPNGAGKSTTIEMMVGSLEPSGGRVCIAGHDIAHGSPEVYDAMGVCPQDNLLWETLTAAEHLSFYGRLKGLQGRELTDAVAEALAAVHLSSVAGKQVKTFSGGMKRRLSVAISLIGSPQVCYLDEPSTGLDPASRHALWNAIKAVKASRAIILTTHSMQEAEALCDRLGIIVDGRLVCIGNPKDLTGRYGNYLEFSITVPPAQLPQARAFARSLSAGAVETYALAGTLRYDLPTSDVRIEDVFAAMQRLPEERGVQVLDWGLANATLEEVFIKVARHASAAKP